MKTELFTKKDMQKASQFLSKGELIAFPTETVYGLGADALNEEAVKQVYAAKGRPSDNPLIVHVSSQQMFQRYVPKISTQIQLLINQFWPGPLTIVCQVKESTFSPIVTGGLTTVAFRMPKNDLALQFIATANTPVVGPSANTSGKPSPTTAQHVYHDLHGRIAGILDDGSTKIGIESTVLDMSSPDHLPLILRPGVITKKEIEKVIGPIGVDKHLISPEETPKAPGMKYQHYSPNVPVWIVDGDKHMIEQAIMWAKSRNQTIGLYADDQLASLFEEKVDKVFSFGETTVNQAAKCLFAGLRNLDKPTIDLIFAQGFTETGFGVAYMNRLNKAANQKKFEKNKISE